MGSLDVESLYRADKIYNKFKEQTIKEQLTGKVDDLVNKLPGRSYHKFPTNAMEVL
jgi:hypothetical protein